MRARLNSNFTYADRAGNIFYRLERVASVVAARAERGDSIAIPVRQDERRLVALRPLRLTAAVLNPNGGYIQNENDAPYYTNMRQPLDPAKVPAYFPPPKLGLALPDGDHLVDNDRKMSLEDVIRLKHSYRMMLADRVRDDLVAAVRAIGSGARRRERRSISLPRGTRPCPPRAAAACCSTRGGAGMRSRRGAADSAFAEPWSAGAPIKTPRGIAIPQRAAEAFAWAVAERGAATARADVAWGDVHRVRRGEGRRASGRLRERRRVLSRAHVCATTPDGKLVANGSDGWILAVEFGDEPRAYSVLAYGESPKPEVAVFQRPGGDVRAR